VLKMVQGLPIHRVKVKGLTLALKEPISHFCGPNLLSITLAFSLFFKQARYTSAVDILHRLPFHPTFSFPIPSSP
jgi:hypothetical protein